MKKFIIVKRNNFKYILSFSHSYSDILIQMHLANYFINIIENFNN
jgi:hypothetical protein